MRSGKCCGGGGAAGAGVSDDRGALRRGPQDGAPPTIFRYHRMKADVPAGHPHALRHTFGTALAEAGVDLAVLQALMGQTMSTPRPPTSICPQRMCAPPTTPPVTASAR